MDSIALPNSFEEDARTKLKREARRLFADKGYSNVTVREIAAAAGQKNHGAVGYYFAAKENLAKEILIEGAIVIEAERNALLDAMESRQRVLTVRDVAEAIILPSAHLMEDAPVCDQNFNRFLFDIVTNHSEMVEDALQDRWNKGYQRCLTHMRALMPGLTLAEKNRRFVFLGLYVAGILALREKILADTTRGHAIWQAPSTLDDLIETTMAILLAQTPKRRM